MTQSCQYVMEVAVVPPGEGYQWAAAYSNQVLLVVSLVAFRSLIGGIEWILEATGKLRGPKLSEKGKMMVEMSKSIAAKYNVGTQDAGTGVRFEDVQVPPRRPLRLPRACTGRPSCLPGCMTYGVHPVAEGRGKSGGASVPLLCQQ